MVVRVCTSLEAPYRGLRMTADEYLAIGETSERYELVDGVVVMSPSASLGHQKISMEVALQIALYLRSHPIGDVVMETDVRLRDDLVYQPDVVFLRAEAAARCTGTITETPDLIVEVISPDSRGYDSRTKRNDYEAAGVGEYWIIDPARDRFHFLILREGVYLESAAAQDRYIASVLPGFELDLEQIRRLF